MKTLIPFWLAVTITVVVSLPVGVLLDNYNIPLWVAFIVWAQYFNYEANFKKAGRIIFPCTFAGAFFGLIGMMLTVWLSTSIPILSEGSGIQGTAIGLGIGVAIMVYLMGKSKILTEGSLSYFNGLSVFLGVYFTGSYPKFECDNPYLLIFTAFIWTVIAGYFGFLLAWFNIAITFPRKQKEE